MNKALEKWEEKQFESCIENIQYTNKIPKKDFKENGFFPIISQEEEFINGYWDKEKDLFKIKKPLVIFGDHTKNIKYVDFDFVLGADGVKIISTIDDILPKYMYYYLQNIQLRDLGYARHYKLLKGVVVKYPSLSEQQRIVKILDEAFENIEKAKQNALQNLSNVKELFESYVEQIFHYDCENIVSVTFSQEFKIKSGDFLSAQNMNLNGGYNVYGGNGINGKHDTYNYSGENIIIGRVGEKCGNIHYVNDDIWVTDNAFVLIDTEHGFDKRFLYYLLIKLNLRQYATKTTHPVISGKSLKDVKLRFPENISEQQKIVTQLDELQEQTKKLEQIYEQKIKDIDELKQSILQKAFNGEL